MELIRTKRFITSKTGRKTDVILDIKTYERILDDLEELHLMKEYDKAKKRTELEIKSGNYVTLKDYIKKRTVTVLRKNGK